MKFVLDVVALIISGGAIWYACRSNKLSKEALKCSLYEKRKKICDVCIECLQHLKLLGQGKVHAAPDEVIDGEYFRNFLANIDGYEDFYKGGEKDWIGELRDHAYGFLKDISNNKMSDERLGERLNCKPVKEDLGRWVEKQDIESIKRKFQKHTNVSDIV